MKWLLTLLVLLMAGTMLRLLVSLYVVALLAAFAVAWLYNDVGPSLLLIVIGLLFGMRSMRGCGRKTDA